MQVRKKSNNQIYAMKILKKKAIVARNQVEHTKAERQILQSLQHPFLMTMRYAFQTKEKLYFVLDYYQVRSIKIFLYLLIVWVGRRVVFPLEDSASIS